MDDDLAALAAAIAGEGAESKAAEGGEPGPERDLDPSLLAERQVGEIGGLDTAEGAMAGLPGGSAPPGSVRRPDTPDGPPPRMHAYVPLMSDATVKVQRQGGRSHQGQLGRLPRRGQQVKSLSQSSEEDNCSGDGLDESWLKEMQHEGEQEEDGDRVGVIKPTRSQKLTSKREAIAKLFTLQSFQGAATDPR